MRGLTKNLIGASAASMILLILQDGDSYGYEILQRMKSLTEGELTWQEATIYPMLKELENKGMVKSYWKINPGDRARKYYTLLEQGKTRVTQDKKEWNFARIMFSRIWSLD
jgi:DNA-binding PadR family transcriptional regulator